VLIYKITNITNNKVYIGQTRQSIAQRWCKHCRCKKTNRLYSAIKHYGRDNFTIVEIDRAVNEEELNQKEIHWITFYDSTNKEKGYNIAKGGNQSPCSEETKLKIGKANSNKTVSKETRQKQSLARLGKKLSLETRQRMSKSRTGRVCSEETKHKLREKRKLYKIRPETLKKYSEIRKGKDPFTPEQRASFNHKLRVKRPGTGDKLKGIPRSEETKKRISEGRKRGYLKKLEEAIKLQGKPDEDFI